MNPENWLPAGRPGSVAIQDGKSAVDIYLRPDIPIKLLVSNLGWSHQSSLMTVRVSPLSGGPRLRPVIVSGNLVEGEADRLCGGRANDIQRSTPCRISEASTAMREGAEGNLIAPVTREFWLHVTAEPLEDPRGYQLVSGRLVAESRRCWIYADSSLYQHDECPTAVQHAAREIADTLDQNVLSEIESRLGAVADVDGDGRLTVLMTPWLGRLRGGATQVRGFVRSSDFREEISSPFSNHADVLYLNSEVPSGRTLRTLLLHEVAHAALFSKTAVRKVAGRSASGIDIAHAPKLARYAEWEDWLNEGLAHLSERSGGGDWSNLDYRVARYWQRPASTPLIVRDYYRCGRWRDHGCRGATFLFLNWCQGQYAAKGRRDFMAVLAASGSPGMGGVESSLGYRFEDLYRAWTVSVARDRRVENDAARIGRFAVSGPRSMDWDVTRNTQRALDVTGTATQFVELRATRPQWYRLSFDGDPRQPWQVTLFNSTERRPAFELQATWDQNGSDGTASLVVSLADPLPAGWQIERICCEEIRESRPRAWQWLASEIAIRQESERAVWRTPQHAVELPILDVDPAATVIKVCFQKATGERTWGWCDVPARLPDGVPRTSVALSPSDAAR